MGAKQDDFGYSNANWSLSVISSSVTLELVCGGANLCCSDTSLLGRDHNYAGVTIVEGALRSAVVRRTVGQSNANAKSCHKYVTSFEAVTIQYLVSCAS